MVHNSGDWSEMGEPPSPDGGTSIGGDLDLLTEAVARLRTGLAEGNYRADSPWEEFAMLAISRLLEALAGALARGHSLPPDVVARGTEVARHVLRYLDQDA